ncbi:MAG: transglutaminase domain-containing protein [Chloroflexota bacterium]
MASESRKKGEGISYQAAGSGKHHLPAWGLKYLRGGVWEWVGVLFAFLTIEVSLRSIEKAAWILPQPPFTLILLLSVLTAWLLAKSRLPVAAAHLSALALGVAITAWQASSLLSSPDAVPEVTGLIVRMRYWWQLITTTSPSEGTLYFTTFLILFTWAAGYLAIWSILRRQNAWVAVLLSGITIMVNLSNLTEEYYIFFFPYLVFAPLLVGVMNLAQKLKRFRKTNLTCARWGMGYTFALLTGISLLAILTAWQIPQIHAAGLETLISKNISLRKILEDHNLNLFAEVPSKQPSLTGSRQRELHFSDYFHRGENIQFVITSEFPAYWRTQVYDTYTGQGWESRSASSPTGGGDRISAQGKLSSGRRELTYDVETRVKTDVLLTAGEFSSCDIPTSLEILPPLILNIDMANPSYDSFLPGDIALFTSSLRTAREEGRFLSLTDIQGLLPPEVLLTGIGKSRYPPTEANYERLVEHNWLTDIEVTTKRRGPDDAVAVLTRLPLEANQSYTITTNVTTATPSDLMLAGDDYPPWVTDYYLKLHPGLSERVRQLAKSITGEAPSAYEKVVAIKRYLSGIPYRENAENPPHQSDGVDYFLFIRQSGNCSYFASTMAMLLRLNDIPTRLCSGFLPGELDTATGRFTIRAKHYHAWVEVYFPGYGWIDFDATPNVTGEGTDSPEEGSSGQPDNSSTPVSDAGDETGIPAGDTGKDSAGEESIHRVSNVDRQPVVTVEMVPALPLITGIMFAVLLVIALVSAFYGWLWHFTGPDYGSEVYTKMCFLASCVRLRPKEQQTPLEYGAMLTEVFPPQAESIRSIIQTYQASRYGRKNNPPAEHEAQLERSWKNVYTALLRRLFRPG